jgi:hypothetical protein
MSAAPSPLSLEQPIMAILNDLTAKTPAELIAIIMAQREASQRKLTMKVTEERLDEKTGKMVGSNGAMSIYGLGRFPITLYRGQWERLLGEADAIRAFIVANADRLTVKE